MQINWLGFSFFFSSSGEPRSLSEQLRDVPVLLRHLWWRLRSGEGLDLLFRARMAFLAGISIAYVVLPFDILPGNPGGGGGGGGKPTGNF